MSLTHNQGGDMEVRGIKTRDLILQAAKKLFFAKGFYETSMSQIAEESGLGKGTLYWYFTSKEELFNEMLKREVENVIKRIRENIKQQLPYEQILKRIIAERLEKMGENKKGLQFILEHQEFINKETRDNLFQLYLSLHKEIQGFFNMGMERGILRKESSNLMAAAMIGLMQGMAPLLKMDQVEKAEVVEFLYRFIAFGIMKDKNREGRE